MLRKCIATAFVLYCHAKQSDTLRGSSHVRCYLLLGGCGQKWEWLFRSWNSKICCISRMNRLNKLSFLHVDRNLGKLNVNLIIIAWAWSNMGETF